MNTNLIHNILNLMIAIGGVGTAALLVVGCVEIAGHFDCSASPVDPAVTSAVTGALGVLKAVINLFRDGVAGLYKPQPPVNRK